MKDLIQSLKFAGTLALGSLILGCPKEDPADIDVKQRLKLVDKSNSGNIDITTNTLESEYVNPSEIEIQLRDQNQNGKFETVLQYHGQGYLMKYDKDKNRAKLVPYEKRIFLKEEPVDETQLEKQ